MRPRFDKAGRAWLRARLAADLPVRVNVKAAPERVPHLVAWYCTRWRDVVAWVPADAYRGPDFAAGGWAVRWAWVLDRAQFGPAWRWAGTQLAAERAARELAADAERFPTLDAWLEADRTGQLAYAGALEPDASELLPRAARAAYLDGRSRRRATWPRLCAVCDEEFRPARPNTKRCPACRATATVPRLRPARVQGASRTAPEPTPPESTAAAAPLPRLAAAAPVPGDGALWYEVRSPWTPWRLATGERVAVCMVRGRAWIVGRDGEVRSLPLPDLRNVFGLYESGVLAFDAHASRQPV